MSHHGIDDNTTTPPESGYERLRSVPPVPLTPALVVEWSRAQPWRAGEVALVERDCVCGRGSGTSDAEVRLRPGRQRRGPHRFDGPFRGDGFSRRALRFTRFGDALIVTRLDTDPRRRIFINGRLMTATRARLAPGDVLEIEGQLLFYVTRRAAELPDDPMIAAFPHGEPDAHGIVGESPAAWALRVRLAFVARLCAHVLILGESGTGKELAARAIHAYARPGGPFKRHNLTTLPATLIDAALFGNRAGFPDSSQPDRAGSSGARTAASCSSTRSESSRTTSRRTCSASSTAAASTRASARRSSATWISSSSAPPTASPTMRSSTTSRRA